MRIKPLLSNLWYNAVLSAYCLKWEKSCELMKVAPKFREVFHFEVLSWAATLAPPLK